MLEPIEIDPKTFLREHCSLPALPEAVIRIQEMMQDEGYELSSPVKADFGVLKHF